MYLILLLFLALVTPAAAQGPPPPTNPVVLPPDVYNAVWNYLVQADCKNPLQLLNALQLARQQSEPHKEKVEPPK